MLLCLLKPMYNIEFSLLWIILSLISLRSSLPWDRFLVKRRWPSFIAFLFLKGREPHTSLYSVTPTDQTVVGSARNRFCMNHSGGVYSIVPVNKDTWDLAKEAQYSMPLRTHGLISDTCKVRVRLFDDVSTTKVKQLDFQCVCLNQNVFWLDITMKYSTALTMLQCLHQLKHYNTCRTLSQGPVMLLAKVSQVLAWLGPFQDHDVVVWVIIPLQHL